MNALGWAGSCCTVAASSNFSLTDHRGGETTFPPWQWQWALLLLLPLSGRRSSAAATPASAALSPPPHDAHQRTNGLLFCREAKTPVSEVAPLLPSAPLHLYFTLTVPFFGCTFLSVHLYPRPTRMYSLFTWKASLFLSTPISFTRLLSRQRPSPN